MVKKDLANTCRKLAAVGKYEDIMELFIVEARQRAGLLVKRQRLEEEW